MKIPRLALFGASVVAAASLMTDATTAQAPAGTSRFAFEVASIKQSKLDRDGGSMGFRPGGVFIVENFPLNALVQIAFKTDPPLLRAQIVGLPDWASTTRYDISAKVSTDKPPDTTAANAHRDEYLRSLLEDRFAFKAHLEKRELPVYALVVAPGGPKMRSGLDCSKPENRPKCGISFDLGRLTGESMLIANLTGTLATQVGRPVLNRTGLEARFAIDLQWNPSVISGAPDDPNLPSIFTAVEEQLGLKLESTRAPVDVLVVDRLEHPTED